mmetsp:Transcript_9022/g.27919  ORF Transcript_9022/g.27919 Transcript_9022/m.27919 type:complete len:315 (-) Transcript_9022:69-1013(-)
MKLFAILAVVLFIGAAVADHVDLYAGEITNEQCVPSSGFLGGVWGNAGLSVDWAEQVALIHLTHSIPVSEALSVASLYLSAKGTNAAEVLWTFTSSNVYGQDDTSAASPCFASVDFSDRDYTQSEIDAIQFALSNGQGYIQFGGPAPYTECAARAQIYSVPSFGATLKAEAKLNGENEVPPFNGTATGSAKAYYDSSDSVLQISAKWGTTEGDVGARQVHLHYGAAGSTGIKVMYLSLEGNNKGSAETFINAYAASQIVASATYVNVHSDFNEQTSVAGELRGQLFITEFNPSSASSMVLAFSAVFVALIAALL